MIIDCELDEEEKQYVDKVVLRYNQNGYSIEKIYKSEDGLCMQLAPIILSETSYDD